ncbi:hypothetical protein H0H81_012052 [Sphagnurus paluster]|uniref:SH3 domain-containing protein n=1 Tax=Sphagnurus paluster TaxID=117069 RepID=A0A9P7GI83_9AGAR|nr:hypothetical protein H0H81_012052 [Sphagnurus paluster]
MVLRHSYIERARHGKRLPQILDDDDDDVNLPTQITITVTGVRRPVSSVAPVVTPTVISVPPAGATSVSNPVIFSSAAPLPSTLASLPPVNPISLPPVNSIPTSSPSSLPPASSSSVLRPTPSVTVNNNTNNTDTSITAGNDSTNKVPSTSGALSSQGVPVGTIVGIVLAVLLVLIAALVIAARRRRAMANRMKTRGWANNPKPPTSPSWVESKNPEEGIAYPNMSSTSAGQMYGGDQGQGRQAPYNGAGNREMTYAPSSNNSGAVYGGGQATANGAGWPQSNGAGNQQMSYSQSVNPYVPPLTPRRAAPAASMYDNGYAPSNTVPLPPVPDMYSTPSASMSPNRPPTASVYSAPSSPIVTARVPPVSGGIYNNSPAPVNSMLYASATPVNTISPTPATITPSLPASLMPGMAGVAPVPFGAGPSPLVGMPAVSAKVRCTFIPTLPDELHISTGEVIRIHAEYDDGWSLCSNARLEMGMVPLECLDTSGSVSPTAIREFKKLARVSSLMVRQPAYGGA